MPDSLAALERLGVSVPAELGHPFRGIRFLHGETEVNASFPVGRGRGVRREALHMLLVERAASQGVRLLWGTSVTGIDAQSVHLGGERVKARWIIGADGGHSRVRNWSGLDDCRRESIRFGFRRHYRIEPWSDCMELHWGRGCQIYVTPVSREDVCVALISRDRCLRLDSALSRFPALANRLASAPAINTERGAITASRRLTSVVRGNVALIGDASGSVDAITGEGLCLAFHQALSLAEALQKDDLKSYGKTHLQLMRRPAFMANLMLTIDRFPSLRARAVRALSANPSVFARLLAMHVGELPASQFAATTLALGWSLLSA